MSSTTLYVQFYWKNRGGTMEKAPHYAFAELCGALL